MSQDTFAMLEPVFPFLEVLILNGIGEPLLHPRLEEFIRKARGSMPPGSWVGFQTNGMLLDNDRAASLSEAGVDRICLSVDAVSGDNFCTIREGGEIGNIEAALAALNEAKEKSGKKGPVTGIEFVLRRDNVQELPDVVRWAAARGVTFAIVTQLLPYDRAFAARAAYDTNTADAIAIYEKWRSVAAGEGLDVGRYLDIFRRSSRTPEDLRVIHVVEEMKKDAEYGGISLRLDRLSSRDEEWFREVDMIFQEVKEIAQEKGIDLTLPGTSPRNTRRCDFVESKASFVSWNGDVHPCYFLWHRYSCYVGGSEKRVKPWVFGNVRERDFIDLWKDASYSSFREDVLRYNFPFCFDCGFALCDYVADEDFLQDCHIGTVPCGACLWCTGLFHCLQ